MASLHLNQIGYETDGPKIAIQRSSGTATAASFTLKNASGKVVFTGTPKAEGTVPGWGASNHWTLDFSAFTTAGRYSLICGSDSDTVRIGEAQLFSSTAKSIVNYFNAMRNTDDTHHKVAVFGRKGVTRDAYGGWQDASGDAGKYLSHQSTANFMNPQQIPLVDWALMKSWELDSDAMTGYATALHEEAAWGADFLLRMLDPDSSFFYMNVFNVWGKAGEPWELCSWYSAAGTKSSAYQCAWREGGGMAIAALARAARTGISGDSSSAQYLAGAVRAWKVLTKNGTLWADNHKQNLLDDYCALLAHVELYKATGDEIYLDSATGRAPAILKRQQPDGWWAADDSTRPYYSAVDEGLPVVALLEYLDIAPAQKTTVSAAILKNLAWYQKISFEVSNPYAYARLYRPLVAATASGVANLAAGKNVYASASQDGYPASSAVDNSTTTRWGSPLGDSTAWFQVDLGDTVTLDSVRLDWETAYAKTFRIVTGLDSAKGTDSLTLHPSSSGWQSIPLSHQKARWIRIQAVQLLQTYYGISFYELQAYGTKVASTTTASAPGKTAFFMPHNNETGYWWQGENARLGSMATAFFLAGRRLRSDYSDSAADTLRLLAQSQLDWIAGKNPASTCFLYGFGKTNSPAYMFHDNSAAGICNGITSDSATEQMPVFNPAIANAWDNWRWVEQWIPHDAWWLLGVSASRWTRHTSDTATSIAGGLHRLQTAQLVRQAQHWQLSNPSGFTTGEVRLLDLQGRTLWKAPVAAGTTAIALPRQASLCVIRFLGTDGRSFAASVPGI